MAPWLLGKEKVRVSHQSGMLNTYVQKFKKRGGAFQTKEKGKVTTAFPSSLGPPACTAGTGVEPSHITVLVFSGSLLKGRAPTADPTGWRVPQGTQRPLRTRRSALALLCGGTVTPTAGRAPRTPELPPARPPACSPRII